MRGAPEQATVLPAEGRNTPVVSGDAGRSPAEVVSELRRLIGRRGSSLPEAAFQRALLPTGVAAIDGVLGGGLPRGRIVEVTGDAGRMSLVVSAVASAQRVAGGGEELVAVVDVADALCPRAAARAGADLSRLLWVRPRRIEDALRAADLLLATGGFALIVLYGAGAGVARGINSPKRMDHAWPRLLHACERAEVALLVIGDRPLAGSFAAATLHLEGGAVRWRRVPGSRSVITERALGVTLVRSRLGTPGATAPLVLRAMGER